MTEFFNLFNLSKDIFFLLNSGLTKILVLFMEYFAHFVVALKFLA